MKRLTLLVFLAACGLYLSGCKRGEEAAATPAGASTGQIAAAEAPVGTTVDSSVPMCRDTHGGGQFQPITLPDNMGFGWTPVTQPPATRYAVQFTKQAAGATSPAVIVERTFKATEELKVQSGERVTGVNYRVRVVAYGDKGPICIVDGINGLSPMPN